MIFVRLIHTSDWHLGRYFHGVHLTNDQSFILEQLCDYVKDVRPDALLIAGDIYDRAVPPTDAVALLDDTLSKILLDYHVPTLLIAGNHDSADRLHFGSRLLRRAGLYVYGVPSPDMRPLVLADKYGDVAFLPLVYAEPSLVRAVYGADDVFGHEMAMRCMIDVMMPYVPKRARTVAVAHAFIAGGEESESERPLSVGGTGSISPKLFEPFSYTALGHLHGPQKAGSDTVRYSGSLMKYSFSEVDQKKGVQLVELAADGSVRAETVSFVPKRDMRIVEGTFDELMASGGSDDYIAVKLLDKDPILDAKGRLEQKFPHLLQLERASFMMSEERDTIALERPKMSETDRFSAFFEAMTGEKMTDEQKRCLTETIDEVYRSQREVKP